MVDAKATASFISELLEDFVDDEVAQIFLGTAIIGYAEEALRWDQKLLYYGCIRGSEWARVAKKILEKRALTFSDQYP